MLILYAALICCYFPAFQAGLVNFDDASHFFGNPLVLDHSWGGILNIFLEPNTANHTYIPLTILSFNLEHLFFGVNPHVSHLINLGLFLAMTGSIYRLGRALGLSGTAALIAAAIFGLHPIHVEPVMWITSRKDMLYGLCYLGAILVYLRYKRQQHAGLYILTLSLAVLAALAKPMTLSLPMILLLLDWLQNRPVFRLTNLLEKIPLLLAVDGLALVTYLQNSRHIPLVFPDALLIWLWSATFYIHKFFWPAGLSPIYTLPEPVSLFHGPYLASGLSLVVLIVILIRCRPMRWLMFGLLFYALSTFFLWRYDRHDLTIVADRFMLVASAGICLFLGQGLAKLMNRSRKLRAGSIVLLTAILIAMGLLTNRQTKIWTNCWTFWSSINATPTVLSGRLKCLLVDESFDACRIDVEHYIAARTDSERSGHVRNSSDLSTQENSVHVPCVLRNILTCNDKFHTCPVKSGIPAEAISSRIDAFRFCLARHNYRLLNNTLSSQVLAYNMAQLYARIKDPRAETMIRDAIRRFPAIHSELKHNGMLALVQGQFSLAIKYFSEALQITPDEPSVLAMLAAAKHMANKEDPTRSDLCAALKIAPQDEIVRSMIRIYFNNQMPACSAQ